MFDSQFIPISLQLHNLENRPQKTPIFMTNLTNFDTTLLTIAGFFYADWRSWPQTKTTSFRITKWNDTTCNGIIRVIFIDFYYYYLRRIELNIFFSKYERQYIAKMRLRNGTNLHIFPVFLLSTCTL